MATSAAARSRSARYVSVCGLAAFLFAGCEDSKAHASRDGGTTTDCPGDPPPPGLVCLPDLKSCIANPRSSSECSSICSAQHCYECNAGKWESSDNIDCAQEIMDAGPARDAGRDAEQRSDAATDGGEDCYSVLRAPERSTGLRYVPGCECPVTMATRTGGGYCINGWAVWCSGRGLESRWSFGADGACRGWNGPAPTGFCGGIGGTLVPFGNTCPSGFDTQRGYNGPPVDAGLGPDAGPGETDTCCSPFEVTSKDCTLAGLVVLAAARSDRSLQTTCSNGGALRGFVVGGATPSVCCAQP